MNSPMLPAPLFVTQLTNEGTSARLLGHFLALYCCLRFSSTPKERPAQTSCRTLLPPLPATLFRSTSSRYSSTRLEASLPASTPVIVNTGRTVSLLQQQWQVFKEAAVYTRMLYTANRKSSFQFPLASDKSSKP